MNSRLCSIRLLFGAGLSAALLWLLPPTTSAADDDIIGSVTRHWSQRQASITTCCVKYTGTVLYPAKSMQHEPRIGPGLFPDRDVVGDIDMEVILDFARGRFRANCLRHQAIDDEIVKQRTLYLFDGQLLVKYLPKDDPANAPRFPSGKRTAEVTELRNDFTNMIFFDEDRPIFFACGRVPIPFENISPFKAIDWRDAPVTAHAAAVIADHKCAVLRWTEDKARPSRYVEVWVDTANPLVVRRYRQIYDGMVNNETLIDYDGLHDVPSGWVQRQFGTPGKPDGLLREYRVKVDRFDINCEPDDAAFTAPSRPGMVVRRGQDHYRVGSDGSSLVPYVDAPTPRRKWAWYLGAALVGLGAVVVVYRYARHRRTAGRPAEENG